MQHCTVCGAAMAPGESICRHCGRAHYGPVCPSCQQPAPTLVREGKVVCSGCGATRGPLAGVPLNLAGQAHRAGSVVTAILAWAIVLGGIFVGGVVGLLVTLIAKIFALSVLWGVASGIFLGGLAGAVGALLMKGSRRLDARAQEIRDEAHEQAVLAMASTRRGAVTTLEVAQNLGISLSESDRLLGMMSQKGRALVEINRDGVLQYTFKDVPGALVARTEVMGSPTGVRVETAVATPAEEARARVEQEYEAIRRATRGS